MLFPPTGFASSGPASAMFASTIFDVTLFDSTTSDLATVASTLVESATSASLPFTLLSSGLKFSGSILLPCTRTPIMGFRRLDKVTAKCQCGSTNQAVSGPASIHRASTYDLLLGFWESDWKEAQRTGTDDAEKREPPNNERPETLFESQDARAALPQNCSPKKIRWHYCPCL